MNSVQVVLHNRKKSDEKRVQVTVFVVIITHLPRTISNKTTIMWYYVTNADYG